MIHELLEFCDIKRLLLSCALYPLIELSKFFMVPSFPCALLMLSFGLNTSCICFEEHVPADLLVDEGVNYIRI